MLNFIWKIVCLVALVTILCLMLTGRVVLNDIKDSTIEIMSRIESEIVEPIKDRYMTRNSGSEEENTLQE